MGRLDERAKKFDDQRVSDLTSIQYQVVNYFQKKGTLPIALGDLNDPLASFMVPTDPLTGDTYIYQSTGQDSFMLCATFAFPSRIQDSKTIMLAPTDSFQTFTHDKGKVCFSRTIDTDLYPIIKK